MSRICIVDYGMGNIASVRNAVAYLGYEVDVSDQADQINRAGMILLPGVGAFGEAMHNLQQRNLIDVLHHCVIENRRPFLGICLGMQLIATNSTEEGQFPGLGWVDAGVRRMPDGGDGDVKVKVPHVGWNTLKAVGSSELFSGVDEKTCFYFDHSYVAEFADAFDGAESSNGASFVAAIEKDNIIATQFHPEKSQVSGLKLLRRVFQRAGMTVSG